MWLHLPCQFNYKYAAQWNINWNWCWKLDATREKHIRSILFSLKKCNRKKLVVFIFIILYWTPPIQNKFGKIHRIVKMFTHGACNLSIDWNRLIFHESRKRSISCAIAIHTGIGWTITIIYLIFLSLSSLYR